MPESILDYLHRVHKEPVPRWLEECDFSSGFLLDRFFESRTVYYPGAGHDGSPIKLFNRSHSAHCFVWVDRCYDFDELMRREGTEGFDLKGYDVRHIHHTDIVIRTVYGPPVHNPSCHMVVYDRRPHLGDEHGAERLALLVVRAEAHSAYEQIYGGRFRGNPPFAVVLQECMRLPGDDRPFGGLRSLMYEAAQRNGLPGFLLVGTDNTRPWPGYVRLENVHSTFGGTVGNSRYGTTERWLYQLRAGKRREHAERVRPHLKVAARFHLPEDRLVEWLEFNGVPPPSGSKWSLRTVRRIGRRLGLWPYRSSLREGRNPTLSVPEDDMRRRRQGR